MTIVSSNSHPLLLSLDQPRRHKKMLRDGSGEVWPDQAEILFSKAITEYDRQSSLASANSHYPPDLPSRNEFIVRYLRDRGLDRTKQQVASHIQQLKKRSSKELAAASAVAAHHAQVNINSTPSPNVSHASSPYQSSNPASPALPNGYNSPSQAPYYGQSSYNSYGNSPPSHTSHNPIREVQICVNETHPLKVSLSNISHITLPMHSESATLTAISASPTGYGISLRVRLTVPPRTDPLNYLATSRIYSYVGLNGNPSSFFPSTTLSNKISVNNVFLLEETDHFIAQPGGQILCPLRMSPQSGVMVAAQGSALPISVQQTIYGASGPLLKMTYELVSSSPQHLTDSSSIYQYPPNSGPFTQF